MSSLDQNALKELVLLEGKHRTNYLELLRLADQTYINKNDVKPPVKLANLEEYLQQRNSLQVSIEKAVAQLKSIELVLSQDGALGIDDHAAGATNKKRKMTGHDEEVMARDTVGLLRYNVELDKKLHAKLIELSACNSRLEKARLTQTELYDKLSTMMKENLVHNDESQGTDINVSVTDKETKHSLLDKISALQTENEKLREMTAHMRFEK